MPPNNPRDFKSDSYQIGNLIRALTESVDGDLVFRDDIHPAGVRLRDLLSSIAENPVIGGQIALNTVDSVYSITDSNITSTSTPVCTLVPPVSGATIYGHSVYGVIDGSFKVELSESPAISGYNLNWMSL